MIRKVGIYYDRRKDRPHIVRWFGEPDADGKQKRYSRSFKRKRDAEAFRAEKMAGFQKGERRDRPQEVALKDFCDDWLRIRGRVCGTPPRSSTGAPLAVSSVTSGR